MSPLAGSTLDEPQEVVADLRRQLVDRTAERDEALAARDEVERKVAERTAERDEA